MPFVGPNDPACSDPSQPPVNWNRACRTPVALVILPWQNGCTIAHKDSAGEMHGCRDVAHGPQGDDCLAAWIDGARRDGLAIEDRRKSEVGKVGEARSATFELAYAARALADEAARAARFIRNQTPTTLRAWAQAEEVRIQEGRGRGSCLPASLLESAATSVREKLQTRAEN